MLKKIFVFTLAFTVLFSITLNFTMNSGTANAAVSKTKFKVAWSHYVGWEPWELARYKGILDKWAKKYGIEIELSEPMDYMKSIELYTSGAYDACVMTNMDALTIPAVGGIDSTAIIIGDFSNGNDAIVGKNIKSMKDLKGRDVMLVMFSVSHYALVRALDKAGMTESDLGDLINVEDPQIPGLFSENPNAIVATWNPILMQVRTMLGARKVFDSSQIPGEIIDMMIARSDSSEDFKKALTGAWYEVLDLMFSRSKEGKEALKYMADFSGGTLAEFKAQLRTTKMFSAQDAAKFARGEEVKKATKKDQLKNTMEYVRTFSFDHGLYGEGAPDKNFVGMAFPDGSIMGDKENVQLRFTDKYMQMAADKKL